MPSPQLGTLHSENVLGGALKEFDELLLPSGRIECRNESFDLIGRAGDNVGLNARHHRSEFACGSEKFIR